MYDHLYLWEVEYRRQFSRLAALNNCTDVIRSLALPSFRCTNRQITTFRDKTIINFSPLANERTSCRIPLYAEGRCDQIGRILIGFGIMSQCKRASTCLKSRGIDSYEASAMWIKSSLNFILHRSCVTWILDTSSRICDRMMNPAPVESTLFEIMPASLSQSSTTRNPSKVWARVLRLRRADAEQVDLARSPCFSPLEWSL